MLVRIPDEVMSEVEAVAHERGIEVADLVSGLVVDGVAMHRGAAMLEERAGRGDLEAALAVLRKVPRVAPDKGDEMPALSSSGGRSSFTP